MKKYSIAAGVSLNEIEGKTVLFSIKTGDSFGLNESGAVLVRHLLDNDFDKTVEECAKLFEVEESLIRTDLTELVDELVQLELLVSS